MSKTDVSLEEHLTSVLAAAAHSVQVPQPPPPLHGPRHVTPRRRRRLPRRWVAGGVGVAAVLSGGSLAAASLLSPHTSYDPLRTRISPTSAAISAAIHESLPPGSRVTASRQIETTTARYDDTTIAAPGQEYDFTVYQKFSSEELDHFGLSRIPLDGGTAWVGSDSTQQRSIYFLSREGIGVYVAATSGAEPAARVATLERVAEQLASALKTE